MRCCCPDVCGWYQQYHVHDLQTNITDPVDIYIDFRIGWQQGCTDNVTVYTSDDNATWNLAGSTTATALDLDGNPVFPQAWSTHTFAIKNYTTPFRYIKISAPKCFNDWSYVTITNASNNTAPTAVLKAPQYATVGKKVVFDATGSYDDQPLTYIWKFGDHSGTTTSVPIVSHTYSDGYYWNGTWYPFTIPQTLTVELRVSDGAASSIDTAQVTLVDYDVDNPPVAYFTYSVENSTVTFNASLSDDDNQITSYDWDFGDGNTGTGETVTHTYAAEGNYTVTLMVTDNSTQTDTYQETVEILTVTDTTPPTVNITSPSAAVYNTTELVLEFTVQDSSVDTCTYSLNGVDEGPAGNGTNITAAEGPNSLTVYCNDTYGNIGSDTVDFTVDLPPNVMITYPNNKTYALVTQLNFTVIDSMETTFTCEYSIDGSAYSPTSSNPTNDTEYSEPINVTSEGSHNIVVRCSDSVSVSNDLVSFTVDATPPQIYNINVNADADSATITWDTDEPANGTVEYGLDTTYGSLVSHADFVASHSLSLIGLQEATTYHFKIEVYDQSGNYNETSDMTFKTEDQTPPSVTINYPANQTYNTTVEWFNFTAVDSIAETMTCNYSVDNETNQTTAQNATMVSIPLTTGEGTHNATVQCYDNSTWSPTVLVEWTQDTIPPTVTITSPENNANFTYSNVSVQYNISESATVYAMLDNDQQPSSDYTNSRTINGQTWYEDPNGSPTAFRNLEDGTHVLHIIAIDSAGNIGAEANVTVNIRTHDPITNILNGTYVETSDSFANIFFNSSAAFLQGFEYSYDNVSWYDMGYSAVPDTNYDWNFTNLDEGLHYLYVRAYDIYGTGPASYVIVNITTQNDLVPKVTIHFPSNPQYNNVTYFTFSVYDDSPTVNCTYSIDGVPSGTREDVPADDTIQTVNITPLAMDYLTHDIYIECNDSVNVGSDSVSFYTPITVNITSPLDNAITNDPTIIFDCSSDESVGYFEVNDSTWLNISTNHSHTFSVSDGVYTFCARAVDTEGYAGPEDCVTNVTIDRVAPYVEVTNPIDGAEGYNTNDQDFRAKSNETDLAYIEFRADDGLWVKGTYLGKPMMT